MSSPFILFNQSYSMRSGHNGLATETRKREKSTPFLRASVAILLFTVTASCSGSDEAGPETSHIQVLDDIPEHIQEVGNLTIYPGDTEPLYSIELIPVQTYGETG